MQIRKDLSPDIETRGKVQKPRAQRHWKKELKCVSEIFFVKVLQFKKVKSTEGCPGELN